MNEEKRTRIIEMLSDPIECLWSDREIARRTNSSPRLVGRVRASLHLDTPVRKYIRYATRLNAVTVAETNALNSLSQRVHALAKSKGWHSDKEGEDHFLERTCNNMHDEVSELHESWRDGKLRLLCDKAEAMSIAIIPPLTCLEEELADIIIRAIDTAAKFNIDIGSAVERKHRFNATRPHRHGGKKS